MSILPGMHPQTPKGRGFNDWITQQTIVGSHQGLTVLTIDDTGQTHFQITHYVDYANTNFGTFWHWTEAWAPN